MYFYKNNISIKDEYINKFNKIKDFVHSEDQKIHYTPTVNLLVYDFFDGISLHEYLDNIFSNNDLPKIKLVEELDFIIEKIFKLFKNIYKKLPGFFHGDLHDKNIIINIKTKELQLIDFGFSCDLNKDDPKISLELINDNAVIDTSLFTGKNETLEIYKNKIRIFRAYDFAKLFRFLIFRFIDFKLIKKEYIKNLKNGFLKIYFNSILEYKVEEDKKIKSIMDLIEENTGNNILYNSVIEYCRSILYKAMYEIDFIKNI